WVLHLTQVVLHAVQSINALLEVVGKPFEQRRYLGVFEAVKLRNDIVALLAGLHPIDKILQPVSPQPEGVDTLGKHPRKKQRVITDMLTDLPFAVERRRRPEHRI